MLIDIIKDAKIELLKNDLGHLPLMNRVHIAENLRDPIKINKVFLACCKLVYSTLEINDSLLSNILNKAERHLYGKENFDFKMLYDKNKNYLEAVNLKPFSDVGLACLALCASIYTDAASLFDIDDYEDDNSYDPESWSTDFCAANAFAGGNPFSHEGSKEKRVEFWNFFLDTVVTISNSPNLSVGDKIEYEEQVSIQMDRSKVYVDSFIKNKIDRVVELILKDLENSIGEAYWNRVEIEGQDIGGVGMKGYYFDANDHGERLELTYYLYDGEESTVKLLSAVKKYIYQQSPEEGTWFSYNLLIYPNGEHRIVYNFDNPKIYADKQPSLEPFITEFTNYPRTKSFTPKWWQAIVTQNNLEYL